MPPSGRLRRRLLLAGIVIASLAAGLLASEVVLRMMGFTFELAPRVEFGWPHPEGMKDWYRHDPDVFWVPRDYRDRLDALASPRADIVFLGDSCTESGSYPDALLARLRRDRPGAVVPGGRIAASGWSSYQGLEVLKRDLAPIHPRVVTIYFGWNDHWVGYGVEDEEVAEITHSAVGLLPMGSRAAQLLLKTRLASRLRDKSGWPRRVPPEKFRANLTEMIRVARQAGILPVLLTAPSSHEQGREPPHLADRFLSDLGQLVPLHRQYVDIVREVAAAQDAPLCDLAAEFDRLPRDRVRDVLFKADGIHLTPAGGEQIADLLADCLSRDPRVADAWR